MNTVEFYTTIQHTLNLSSMFLSVVDVLMVHSPPSSDTSIMGVDTVAAFLNRKFTSNSCNVIYLSKLDFAMSPHLKHLIIVVSRSSLIFPLESIHGLSISLVSVSVGKYL